MKNGPAGSRWVVKMRWTISRRLSAGRRAQHEPKEGCTDVGPPHHWQGVPVVDGRGTSRDEGDPQRAEARSLGWSGRGKRCTREDRRDAETGSRHGRAAPCHHQSQRADSNSENLVWDASLRQRRPGCLLLPKRPKVQVEIRDVRFPAGCKPRRGRHLANLLCSEKIDPRRRENDRQACKDSGKLMPLVVSVMAALMVIHVIASTGYWGRVATVSPRNA